MANIDVTTAFGSLAGPPNRAIGHVRASNQIATPATPVQTVSPGALTQNQQANEATQPAPAPAPSSAPNAAALSGRGTAAAAPAPTSARTPTGASATHFVGGVPVRGVGPASGTNTAAAPPGFAPTAGPASPTGSRSLTGTGEANVTAPQANFAHGGHDQGTFSV